MPLYEGIKDDLIAKIRSGEYEPGDLLPPEVKLAEMYGVSRPTVRQALQILVSEGYVDRRRRRGTVVRSSKLEQSFAVGIRSFVDEMAALDRTPLTKVLLFKEMRADAGVARALEVDEGTEVFKFVRLRYADGEPNVLVETYVPAEAFPGLRDVDLEQASLYAYFTETGRPVVEARRRLEVIAAQGQVASLLDVEKGDPLFYFHTVARDADGVPIECSIATYRGSTNSFEITVSL